MSVAQELLSENYRESTEFELSYNPSIQYLLHTWIWVETLLKFVNKKDINSQRLTLKQFDAANLRLYKQMPYVDPHSDNKKRYKPSAYVKDVHSHTNNVMCINSLPNGEPIYTDKINNLKTLNTWVKPTLTPIKGDTTKFQEFILYLIDEKPEQAKLFTQYLAHIVRHPEIKIKFMTLITSNERGLGKNFLTDKIMKPLVGAPNYRLLDSANEILGNFDDWKIGATLVVLDEVKQTTNKKYIEKLKPLISNDSTRVNQKGKDPIDIVNYMNFIAFSNYQSALHMDEEERRYYVVHNRQTKKSPEWFEQFHFWLHQQNGLEFIYHYFLNEVDLSDFKPDREPPKTSDFKSIASYSKCELTTYIKELVEAGNGLFNSNTMFTLTYFKKFIRSQDGLDQRSIKKDDISSALQDNGCSLVGYFNLPNGVRKELHTFGCVDKLKSTFKSVKTSEFYHEWCESNIFHQTSLLSIK